MQGRSGRGKEANYRVYNHIMCVCGEGGNNARRNSEHMVKIAG